MPFDDSSHHAERPKTYRLDKIPVLTTLASHAQHLLKTETTGKRDFERKETHFTSIFRQNNGLLNLSVHLVVENSCPKMTLLLPVAVSSCDTF